MKTKQELLFDAVKNKNTETFEVQYVLEDYGVEEGETFDINAQDEMGFTALHYAAIHGKNEIVDLLIQYGADTTRVDEDGLTALDRANSHLENSGFPYLFEEPKVLKEKLLTQHTLMAKENINSLETGFAIKTWANLFANAHENSETDMSAQFNPYEDFIPGSSR